MRKDGSATTSDPNVPASMPEDAPACSGIPVETFPWVTEIPDHLVVRWNEASRPDALCQAARSLRHSDSAEMLEHPLARSPCELIRIEIVQDEFALLSRRHFRGAHQLFMG